MTTQAFWRKGWIQQVVQVLVAIVTLAALLVIIGWTTSQVDVWSEQIQSWARVYTDSEFQLLDDAPSLLVTMEKISPVITYATWAVILIGGLFLIFKAPDSLKAHVVESWSLLDIIGGGLVFGAVLGGLTGFLWWYWNPIPILPPVIHLRIFSFLIGLWAILNGRATSAVAGWVGTQVWALLVGPAFVPPHSLIVDGFAVGILTGWLVGVLVRRGMSRAELLQEIDSTKYGFWKYWLRCTFAGAVGCLIMSVLVAASLRQFTPFSWWSGFWSIGILSDTTPYLLWLGPSSYTMLNLTKRMTWLPDF